MPDCRLLTLSFIALVLGCRYLTAQKQFNSGGSVTKMDGIKEEMEEAQSKVDQSRDSLAADIFALLAREAELARVLMLKIHLI